MTTILVTGATGTVGSAVAKTLLEKGAKVRVGVRSPEKAKELKELGAEVVRLDFEDAATFGPAFEGVERAFLLIPFVEAFDELVPTVLGALKDAGASHVVKLSALGADPDAPLVLARRHAAADGAVAESGLGHTILKPTFFQDNILKYQLDAIRHTGAFYGASHGGRISYVSSRDIAEVAAAVLIDPTGHDGQAYLITGPEAITDEDFAAVASEAFGREVGYVDVPDEQYAASMRERGTPEWMVESMLGLEQVKANGYAEAVSPVVEQVLGRSPESLRNFLSRHAGALG